MPAHRAPPSLRRSARARRWSRSWWETRSSHRVHGTHSVELEACHRALIMAQRNNKTNSVGLPMSTEFLDPLAIGGGIVDHRIRRRLSLATCQKQDGKSQLEPNRRIGDAEDAEGIARRVER